MISLSVSASMKILNQFQVELQVKNRLVEQEQLVLAKN